MSEPLIFRPRSISGSDASFYHVYLGSTHIGTVEYNIDTLDWQLFINDRQRPFINQLHVMNIFREFRSEEIRND